MTIKASIKREAAQLADETGLPVLTDGKEFFVVGHPTVYAVYLSSKSNRGWKSDGRMGATTDKKYAQNFAEIKIKNSNRPTRVRIREISGKMGYIDLKTGDSVLPTRKKYKGDLLLI